MSSSFATLPGSLVHGTSQARLLKWTTISSSRGSSQPGIEPGPPALAGRFSATEPQGKPFLWITVSPQVGENGSYLLKVLKYLKIQVYKTQNLDFPCGSVVKNAGDMGSILGLGRCHLLQGIEAHAKCLSLRALEPGVTSKRSHWPQEPIQDTQSVGSSQDPAQPEIMNK